MLVKFKGVVTREPISNRFVEEDIDINCYIPEDRCYVSVQVSPSVLCSETSPIIQEGDTLIVMGNMKFNKSKDGSKVYYNVKAKEVRSLGQQDLSF